MNGAKEQAFLWSGLKGGVEDIEYKRDPSSRGCVRKIFVFSCLGLYGLVALFAVQRTKEIGVRKVLGASLKQLFSLMAKDFMKLIFWALVIAPPLAGIVMSNWLSSYAYHIKLSWWMFIIPAFLIFFIALIVISREIIKTALINPVNTLRTE